MKAFTVFGLVLVALLLFPTSHTFSQTPEPSPSQTPTEVEQLKKRLQQLEQTVVELKGQIDSIEAKKTSTPVIIEAKHTEPATPAETASTEPAKPQNAGESTFQIYGFAMLDAGRFAFVFGQGIQNYMNDAPVDVGIEILPAGDPRRPIRGVALPMWSMVAFLDHNWSKRFSTAIGYSFMDIDNSNGQAANAYHRGHYGLGNLLFYPYENVMVGGEFQWGRRENFLMVSSPTISASSFPLSTTFPRHSHFDG